MKLKRPTEREKAIHEWKCKGKGISWSRWCQMNGISVRQNALSRVHKPRQRVLMYKGSLCSTNDAKA